MAVKSHFFTEKKEITIVGTGHVMRKSVATVRAEIARFKPEAVALELDMGRFIALGRRVHKKPRGIVPLLLSVLQKKAARTTGIRAGSEMMAAAREARKHNIPVVLIDRDIRITLRNGLRSMTLREKARLVWGLVAGFFEVGNKHALDSLISQKETLMLEFKRELPHLYKALVTERDAYMAEGISQLPYSRILVVCGAAHLNGIRKRLEYRN